MSVSLRARALLPRRIRGLWQRLPVVGRDAIGSGVLFLLSLLPLGVAGVELGDLHHYVHPWVPPVLVAGQTLALALRRLAPAPALAIVGVAFAAAQLAGVATGVAGLGLFVAIYSFAAYGQHHRRIIAIVAAACYVLLAIALHAEGSPNRPLDWATFFVVLTMPWVVGQLVRHRIAEQAAREAGAAETAVRESRNLLARDLHDIVTHHVTAMVVQADSAAYLDPLDFAEPAQTLATIGDTGRRALTELRSLLGALEQTPLSPGDPPRLLEPRTQTVADLVSDARERGYPVTLDEPAEPPAVSRPVAITVYRIAQEALTNAMKHSPLIPVAVTLTERSGRLELRIVNDLQAVDDVRGTNKTGVRDSDPPGRGRRGMADRAALLGGSFSASVVDGRFEVAASFAVDAEATVEGGR